MMIPGLHEITSRIIAIFIAANDSEIFTDVGLRKRLGVNVDIKNYIAGARRIVFRDYGILIMAIRGVGLKRMSNEEKGKDQNPRLKRVTKAIKRNVSISDTIDFSNLSPQTQRELLVTNAINSYLLDDKKKKEIKIATIDGMQNVVDIMEASKKRS